MFNVNVLGRIKDIGEVRTIKIGEDKKDLVLIDFTVSVDRGAAGKRTSLYNGDDYSVDFHKITLVGDKKVNGFKQYAKKDRMIFVSGDLVEEEYWSERECMIDGSFPDIYAYYDLIHQEMSANDPNQKLIRKTENNIIFVKAKQSISRMVVRCNQYRWADSNYTASNTTGNFAPATGIETKVSASFTDRLNGILGKKPANTPVAEETISIGVANQITNQVSAGIQYEPKVVTEQSIVTPGFGDTSSAPVVGGTIPSGFEVNSIPTNLTNVAETTTVEKPY